MESRLTLVRKIPRTRPQKGIYRCACGTEREFVASNVTAGATRSCGCLRREHSLARMREHASAFSRGNRTHGRYRSPEHISWHSMIQRCTNPNRHNYKWYGERGITVCDRWLEFPHFFEDMGERPAGTTLERIDNEKGYEPGNCVWATWAEQAKNRRARRPSAR